jgi:hypothetical protein
MGPVAVLGAERGDAEDDIRRAAQEGGVVYGVSRASEVWPGAVVLWYGEGERGGRRARDAQIK